MGRIATLPMYDRPELRWATDQLWTFLRDRLREAGATDVPEELVRGRHHADGWADDRLLFSQACGYDVHLRFPERLTPLAAPRYGAEGCVGATYCSVIVVRAGDDAAGIPDLRSRRAAYNEPTSHSGRVALAAVVAEHAETGRFFRALVETGSHEASADAVASGAADVAALDCTSWALLRRARPRLDEALRILVFTPRCPAPPFVVGPAVDVRERKAIADALAQLSSSKTLGDVRAALLLDGVESVVAETYAACGALADGARAQGYDLLADTDPGSAPPTGSAN